jgi:hypothetical protein
VISCSQLCRISARQQELFKAKKLGTLPPEVARKFEIFVATVPTLNRGERALVLAALAKIV